MELMAGTVNGAKNLQLGAHRSYTVAAITHLNGQSIKLHPKYLPLYSQINTVLNFHQRSFSLMAINPEIHN